MPSTTTIRSLVFLLPLVLLVPIQSHAWHFEYQVEGPTYNRLDTFAAKCMSAGQSDSLPWTFGTVLSSSFDDPQNWSEAVSNAPPAATGVSVVASAEAHATPFCQQGLSIALAEVYFHFRAILRSDDGDYAYAGVRVTWDTDFPGPWAGSAVTVLVPNCASGEVDSLGSGWEGPDASVLRIGLRDGDTITCYGYIFAIAGSPYSVSSMAAQAQLSIAFDDSGVISSRSLSFFQGGILCDCYAGFPCSNPIDLLADARGNRFEFACLGGEYYALVYIPVSGAPSYVGKCPWWGGVNDNVVKYVDENPKNGIPDYFLESWYQSTDSLCDDYDPNNPGGNTSDGKRDRVEYTFDPCGDFVRVDHKLRAPLGTWEKYLSVPYPAPKNLAQLASLHPDTINARNWCVPPASLQLEGDGPMRPITSSLLVAGVAAGGTVTILVGMDSISVATSPGQSADALASALASAVNADVEMQDQGFVATAAGSVLILVGLGQGRLSYCPSDPGLYFVPPVEGPWASIDSTGVLLRWLNPTDVVYDEIYVNVDGTTIGYELPGTTESYLDTVPRFSGSIYTVVAYANGLATCRVEVPLSGAVTGVREGGTAGGPEARLGLVVNYPNPFNPNTTIRYSIRIPGHVDLRIYDVHGRLVRALVNGPRGAGDQTVTWDGRDSNGTRVASGIYFVRLESNGQVQTHKIALLK